MAHCPAFPVAPPGNQASDVLRAAPLVRDHVAITLPLPWDVRASIAANTSERSMRPPRAKGRRQSKGRSHKLPINF